MSDNGDCDAPAPPDRRGSIIRVLQLLLIAIAFGYAFWHGIAIDEHNIGYQPIYRVRQAAAVALSRMHEPAPHGYLAYGSVVEALSRHGLAADGDGVAPPAGDDGRALLYDAARLDRALHDARFVAIDASRPTELIKGEDLAYADYMYVSFVLFGPHFSSLYYFYFLLLGSSCLAFVIAFHRSPFLMFVLLLGLAGTGFVENYARSRGVEMASVANSRLFEALSLVPAIHLFALTWRRAAPHATTLALAAGQSCLLAFLVECRITARWQIAMIAAAALTLLIVGLWRQPRPRTPWRADSWNAVWPAALAVGALAMYVTAIGHSADERYRSETRYHPIWHEVLRGLLGGSVELQRDYLGQVLGPHSLNDSAAYDAIINDLNRRRDSSSPIASAVDGRIVISSDRSGAEYERLARNLVIDIIVHHPGATIAGLLAKVREQPEHYYRQGKMTWPNLASAAVFAALGAMLWIASAGLALTARDLLTGVAAALFLLAFATVPTLIAPTSLSVGTLLSYLGAMVLELSAAAALAAKALRPHRPLAGTPTP